MPIKTLFTNHKPFIVLLVIVFLYSILTSYNSTAFASSTPLDKAQADYSYQVTKYAEIKDKYETTKSQYLTFKTVASKNEAFGQTQLYLIQISNVYKAYLFLAEERTNTISWDYASTSRDNLHKQIEEDTKYFDSISQNVSSAKTLEELPSLAKEIQKHVETKTLIIAFNTLSITDLAKTEYVNALFHQNSKIVADFTLSRLKDKQLYNNWQSEVGTLQNNLDKEIAILKNRPTRTEQFSSLKPKFTYDSQKTTDLLSTSKSLLREILNFI
jgi:hypothetical protein